MAVKSISYTSFPFLNSQGEEIGRIYKPLIPIRLKFGHFLFKTPVSCLLDSGADRNLFPADWGEGAGIKIKKGKQIPITGIGDNKIIAYSHRVKLYVGTLEISTEVDFSYEQEIPLLGREGFFDKFKQVVINEQGKHIELHY